MIRSEGDQRILKFPTGSYPPAGSIYLSTVTQTSAPDPARMFAAEQWLPCWLVWHYFLVPVSEAEHDNEPGGGA